jgi:hypothetical protein
MTMSSAPTAELPVIGPLVGEPAPEPPVHPAALAEPPAPAAPLIISPPALGEAAPPAQLPCRADLRAERRLARRYRRRHAALGFAVLVGTLGATVAVLDVLH